MSNIKVLNTGRRSRVGSVDNSNKEMEKNGFTGERSAVWEVNGAVSRVARLDSCGYGSGVRGIDINKQSKRRAGKSVG